MQEIIMISGIGYLFCIIVLFQEIEFSHQGQHRSPPKPITRTWHAPAHVVSDPRNPPVATSWYTSAPAPAPADSASRHQATPRNTRNAPRRHDTAPMEQQQHQHTQMGHPMAAQDGRQRTAGPRAARRTGPRATGHHHQHPTPVTVYPIPVFGPFVPVDPNNVPPGAPLVLIPVGTIHPNHVAHPTRTTTMPETTRGGPPHTTTTTSSSSSPQSGGGQRQRPHDMEQEGPHKAKGTSSPSTVHSAPPRAPSPSTTHAQNRRSKSLPRTPPPSPPPKLQSTPQWPPGGSDDEMPLPATPQSAQSTGSWNSFWDDAMLVARQQFPE